MEHKRLLDRQLELLEYLTSPAAIFGDVAGQPSAAAPAGIDRELLRLEARFSHDKRMEKIIAVFARTFELLGDDGDLVVREFAAACPPVTIGRLANARQFHGFLLGRWRRRPPQPRWLPDVAAYELVHALARGDRDGDRIDDAGDAVSAPRGSIRRGRRVALLRCAFDIRPVFADTTAAAVERDTPLAVVLPADDNEPLVFEVLPIVFELLGALDDWTDPAALGLDDAAGELIADLVNHGLLEVQT